MQEQPAQIVLLVRAFEETDHEGVVVPMQARVAATRRALRVTGLADWTGDLYEAENVRNGETVMRRARLLFDSLSRKIPALRLLPQLGQLGATTAPVVVVAALGAGLLTQTLGPGKHVNLLSFPVLGLIAWNLLMYAAIPLRRSLPGGEGITGRLSGLFLRGAMWRRLQGWKLLDDRPDEERRLTAKALVRFAAMWRRCAARLLASRVKRMLHLGAMAMAAGAVAGMYLRGVTLEYRATWESTWLDAGQVQALLDVVLGPAALVLGTVVPDVAPLRAEASGPAGPWIHLYATSVVLFVMLPRTLLFIAESVRGARLAADVPLDLEEGYYRRLFQQWRGVATRIDVVPYSYEPEAGTLDRLKSLLRDQFGARADIRLGSALAYGDAADRFDSAGGRRGPWTPRRNVGEGLDDPEAERCRVILFNLAQSPELEVHGAFLEELRGRLGESERLLVMIDVGAYHSRVRSPERRSERLRSWERVLQHAGVEAVPLDREQDVETAGQAMARALGQPSAPGVADP